MKNNNMIKKGFLISLMLVLLVVTVYTAAAQIQDIGDTPKEIDKLNKDDSNAKVEFSGSIYSLETSTNLLKEIKTSPFSVSIDSQSYPELNKPATITFYNCNMNNPIALHNGIWQPSVKVFKVGNTCIMDVNSWSVWSLTDTEFNGTHNFTMLNSYGYLQREANARLILNFTNEGVDNSYYQNNGTITGATTDTPVDHCCGTVYNFDGIDDYIEVPNLDEMNNLTGTISLWAKGEALEGYLFSMDGGELYNPTLYRGSDGSYEVRGLTSTALNITSVNNSWNLITITWDENNASVYLNTTLMDTDTRSTISPAGTLKLGKYHYESGSFPAGWFNESYNSRRVVLNTTTVNYATLVNSTGGATNGYYDINPSQCANNITNYFSLTDSDIICNDNYSMNVSIRGTNQSGSTDVFNDNTTLFLPMYSGGEDYTANDNHVIVRGDGMTHHTNGGYIDGAFEFGGTDDYLEANKAAPNTTQDFTISAWINLTQYGSHRMISAQYNTGKGYQWRVDSGGEIDAYVNDGTARLMNSVTTINLNTWYFVALTFNSVDNVSRLYVNGIQEDNYSHGRDRIVAVDDNTIGIFSDGGSHDWVGMIDEVMISTNALSDNELKELYDSYNNAKNYLGDLEFVSGSSAHYNGSLDEVIILNKTLSSSEVTGLYNDMITSGEKDYNKYYEQGTFTSDIINSSDYNPEEHTNFWRVAVLNTFDEVSDFQGRAGDCDNITNLDWGSGMYSEEGYSFDIVNDKIASNVYVAESFSYTGDITDTYTDDSNYLVVREQVTAPAFDVRFNFTNVIDFIHIGAILEYDEGDTIEVQLWNTTGNYWESIDNFTGVSGFTGFEFNVTSDNEFILNGTVQMRFYHTSGGNPTEYFYIDQIHISNSSLVSIPAYTSNSIVGDCLQYRLHLNGTEFTSSEYHNVTIESFKLSYSTGIDREITTTNPVYANDTVYGNATFNHSDTDLGYMVINWYVNDTLKYTEQTGLISNGTEVEFNLSSGYFNKYENINFTIIATTNSIYGNSTGSALWSATTLFINNSNFSFTYSPTVTNFSQQLGDDTEYNITLTDMDGDVSCSWNATTPTSLSIQTGTGVSFTPDSSSYNPDDIMTVELSCTDGEYTQTQTWTANLTTPYSPDGDYAIIIAAIILIPLIFSFILLFGGVFMSEKHPVLSIFLFLLVFPSFFVSMRFAIISVDKYLNFLELREAIGDTVYWVIWVFFAIIAYFLIYIMIKVFQRIAENKKQELEY